MDAEKRSVPGRGFFTSHLTLDDLGSILADFGEVPTIFVFFGSVIPAMIEEGGGEGTETSSFKLCLSRSSVAVTCPARLSAEAEPITRRHIVESSRVIGCFILSPMVESIIMVV